MIPALITETLKFEVDGQAGTRSSSTDCPIARGIKAVLGEDTQVFALASEGLIVVDRQVYELPKWLVEWAQAFDDDDLRLYERLPFEAEVKRVCR